MTAFVWKPKRRPNVATPTRAADLIPQVVARLGGEQRGFEQRVYTAYNNAVGATFAAHSRPERVKDGVLYVRIESSALAHELTLLRQQVLERMATALGPGQVTGLRTRVGPLDERR